MRRDWLTLRKRVAATEPAVGRWSRLPAPSPATTIRIRGERSMTWSQTYLAADHRPHLRLSRRPRRFVSRGHLGSFSPCWFSCGDRRRPSRCWMAFSGCRFISPAWTMPSSAYRRSWRRPHWSPLALHTAGALTASILLVAASICTGTDLYAGVKLCLSNDSSAIRPFASGK